MKIEPMPEGTGALIARMAADDRKAASELATPETAGPAKVVAAVATGCLAPKRRDCQCECCASSLGKELHMEHTRRVICDQCLGFVARWVIELEHENAGSQPRAH